MELGKKTGEGERGGGEGGRMATTYTSSDVTATAIVRANKRHAIASVFVGAISGFFGGAFGTSGPPSMVFFACVHNISKGQIRGTITAAHIYTLPFRIFFPIYFGIFDFKDKWALYAGAVVSAYIGQLVGHSLHARVNEDFIRQCLLTFILLSSFSLCNKGDPIVNGEIWGYIIIALFLAIIVVFSTGLYIILRVEKETKLEKERIVNGQLGGDEKAFQELLRKTQQQQRKV